MSSRKRSRSRSPHSSSRRRSRSRSKDRSGHSNSSHSNSNSNSSSKHSSSSSSRSHRSRSRSRDRRDRSPPTKRSNNNDNNDRRGASSSTSNNNNRTNSSSSSSSTGSTRGVGLSATAVPDYGDDTPSQYTPGGYSGGGAGGVRGSAPRRMSSPARDRKNKQKEAEAAARREEEAKHTSSDPFADFQRALVEHNTARQREDNDNDDNGSNGNGHGNNGAGAKIAASLAAIPLASLEEIAKRKADEEEKALKPTFYGKKAREELALKRLEEKRAEERAQADGSLDRAAEERRIKEQRDRRDRERREKIEQRERERTKTDTNKPASVRDDPKFSQMIKDAYLGKKGAKKRIIPPSQKFKFSFDWEATDDTSIDINPLYDKRHNTALLYGRGFFGGVDRREQRKKHKFYEDFVASRTAENASNGISAPIRDAASQAKYDARLEKQRKNAELAILQNRHWSEKKLDEMEERDWRIFREDFSIATRGANVPHPLRYWRESTIPEPILAALERVGYKDPSPIQRAAIPIGLKNRDVVGIAETGSGKTCAFLVPMLAYIMTLPRITQENSSEGPYSLVMAPTRELAQQISEECDKLGSAMGIRNVSIVGGVHVEEQSFAMREGVEIIIATPGRMMDCLERRYIVLNRCNYVVLDEADRMIDLNFEPQIIKVMDAMPASNLRPEELDFKEGDDEKKVYRQTIMFSATMPLKVELLAKKYLRHPIFIAIGDRKGRASGNVTQRVEMTTEARKRERLLAILREDVPPFIVFCNSKKSCDSLQRVIEGAGVTCTVLHGGKIQETREASLEGFKDGTYQVLVATDVVGRGIDIPNVQQVINYEMPSDIEKYQHRIGRTGRAGKTGIATSFLTDADSHIFFDLKNMLQASNMEIPHELANHEAAKTKPGDPTARKRPPAVQYSKR